MIIHAFSLGFVAEKFRFEVGRRFCSLSRETAGQRREGEGLLGGREGNNTTPGC